MKRAYIDIPAGQLHYRWAGSGPQSVVLLHMSGSSSDEYEVVGNLLAAQGLRAIALDLPGFGSSTPPPRHYSLADHAAAVLDCLDAMGIGLAYFYGNLATANLAVHLGADHPHRVAGLMLAHPMHAADPDQYAQKRFSPEYSVVVPQADGRHMLELWARAYKYGADAQVCDARCRCLHAAGEWGESLHWALFEDTPLPQLLPALTIPTVVVGYGAFGDLSLLQTAAALIPGGRFDVYPGGTPYIARSHPQAVVEMFLRHFPPPPLPQGAL